MSRRSSGLVRQKQTFSLTIVTNACASLLRREVKVSAMLFGKNKILYEKWNKANKI